MVWSPASTLSGRPAPSRGFAGGCRPRPPHTSRPPHHAHDQRLAEAVDLAQRGADLAVRDVGAGGLHHLLVDVLVLALGGAGERIERAAHLALVALGLEALEPLQLRVDLLARRRLERLARHLLLGRHAVLVDADHGLLAGVDLLLEGQRRVAADLLRDAGLDRRVHAARRVDAGDHLADLGLHLVGQRLDVVGAAERIDHVGQVRLLLEDVLRGDGDARRLLGRHRQHLVVGVGVQRLQPAEDAGHGLHRHARDVVERLLARQVHARGLAVELEAPGARVLGAEALARQLAPRCAGRRGTSPPPRRSSSRCRRRT